MKISEKYTQNTGGKLIKITDTVKWTMTIKLIKILSPFSIEIRTGIKTT